jgi:hypothetical protein
MCGLSYRTREPRAHFGGHPQLWRPCSASHGGQGRIDRQRTIARRRVARTRTNLYNGGEICFFVQSLRRVPGLSRLEPLLRRYEAIICCISHGWSRPLCCLRKLPCPSRGGAGLQSCGKAAEEIGFSRWGTGSKLPRNEGCAELYGYSSAVRTKRRFTGLCQI